MVTSQVTFQYRPSESRQYRECSFTVVAFLQRFLQHVLPKGFVKVRYSDIFGLQTLRQQLQQAIPEEAVDLSE